MEFSIIYSIDVPRSVSIRQFNPPPNQRRLWQMTEGDEQYEFAYLEGRWSKGKHRKFCGILNRGQFDEFVSHAGVFAEDVMTMGSIGAPGCGFGLVPAFSFRSDAEDAIQSAYVTPLASRTQMVEFLKDVSDQHEVRLAIPGILTDDPDQQHLFPAEVAKESEIAERSIHRAFVTIWGANHESSFGARA